LPLLFWDASALAKRYVPESGSDTVDVLFASMPATQMIGTVLAYAETYSTLIRRHNRGSISPSAFIIAKTAVRNEVVNSRDFVLLTVDDAAILAGVTLMEQHNLNATDAAILVLVLRYIRALPAGAPTCLLIAADHRLLSAAHAEGLTTLNPEAVLATEVPTLLASL
jgi:predicted nucleic acid-binding protein